MKSILLLAAAGLLLSFAALSGVAQNSAAKAAESATARLRTFLAADWKYWVGQYPENATLFGYPGENNRWTDYSPEAIASRNQHLHQSLSELEAIPRNELPTSEQLNYDLYREQLQITIDGIKYHDDVFPLQTEFPTNLYMPMNQMGGVQQYIPDVIAQMPMEKASDYRDLIARLNGIPTVIDQNIALMKIGMAQGWTPPKITMRDVAKQAEAQIVRDPMASPLLAAFKNFPASVPSAERQQLTDEVKAAYTQKVAPSFTRLRDFLANTYLPACRDTVSAGALPDGADYYKYLVHWETTTAMTPEQIHQTGLDQVKQIRVEMNNLIDQTGFQGTFADFEKFLNTDKLFVYPSADVMLLHYRAIAKEADPQLAHLFGLLPRLPYGVKEVPAASAPSQTTAYYEPGSPISGRPGYLFVNTYDLPSRPTWAVEDLVLHESVPGHHLQISLAEEMPDMPEFRKQLGYTAFVEGWALYAESLGPEMGFYADPHSKFGYLSAQMWRAVRLVVDTGVHSEGWTRDQAIQYFEENTGQPHLNSVVEVDRYIVWPGQALGYKIGQLKILELRHEAEQKLGAKFDVRKFHDAVLDQGALPLDILEKQVNTWIASQNANPTPH
ncbi:MAG TPA: DUF885 domain-containing protein [Candidatus Acidoferrales bacterium]|nr:DUF885 domain-containing protein [Candidatus Acidoferrales bacterium]